MKLLDQIKKNDNFYVEHDAEEGVSNLYVTKTKKHLGSLDSMSEDKIQFYDNGVLIYKKESHRFDYYIYITFYNNDGQKVFNTYNTDEEGETTWDKIEVFVCEKGIYTITNSTYKLPERNYTKFIVQEEIKEK